ncbi:MAG: methyltransferase RsmF C-terminal domain-like protein [Anaerolineae bacterium]
MMNHSPTNAWPDDFTSRMSAWLGSEALPFFRALGKQDYGLRLNPRRGSLETLRGRIPWETEPIPWCPEGLLLKEEASIGTHSYHTAGVYYSQDPSAMAATVLLDPRPGEWILDLAAAPGSKATHIGARLQGEGVLVANDIARHRTTVLAMNLERMGVTNSIVTNASPDRLAGVWPGLFDAMLVDAPCSGEGTFSRDAQSVRNWSVDTVKSYAYRQHRMLDEAAPLVRPGGRILYGTCTFSPEENEGVIAGFLDQHPDFAIEDLAPLPGMDRGHPEWIDAPTDLERAGRFWPHKAAGHGHFYTLLRRRGEPPDDLPAQWEDEDMPGRVFDLYEKTLNQALEIPPPEKGLILTEDDDCYITPMAPGLWAEVPVLRPGWWVASLRHGKIYPDHASAMALRADQVRATVDLKPEERRLETYLNGGFWTDKGKNGFALVTVDSFPLGWAKRGGGRMRSRYPVHLRRRRAMS